MKKNKTYTSPYSFEGRIPLQQGIILGLQHVFAMFVGNLTPLLIITSACAAFGGKAEFDAIRISLLQNAMIIAGIVTLIQLYGIGLIGGRVPIVMGTSSGFIGVFKSITTVMGGGIAAYGAIMGASIIGGIFEGVLGFFIKPLRKLLPPIVTGVVILSIGLSLIGVGISSFGGGNSAADYGSIENLLVGFTVLIVILIFKHYFKGMASSSCVLLGISVGYVICAIMPMFFDTTFITSQGQEVTKSWVINWSEIASAKWFAIPEVMPVKPTFSLKAIIPVLIMYVVTAVETVGAISGVTEGGFSRDATDKELSGGVICDGIGSSLAALFGVLPNTAFGQNVGLVTITKITNRFALACGATFLIACGLLPKLAALISIMPQSVLGGAAVIMFSSIVINGIQLITKEPLTSRSITIVSVALGLGYGLGSNSDILVNVPSSINLIIGGSGIVPAAIVALVLNLVLPKENKSVKN